MTATPARIQRAVHVEKLFPAGVVAFETRDGASPDDLLPSEREYIARAVETRVAEFAAGRLCARAGIEALGLEPASIPSGKDRAPIWPAGVVGSITHTDDYCVAVVGDAKAFTSLGVDAEAAGRLKPDLWHLTLHTEERQNLQGVEEAAARAAATVLFSAKEAFYKCQYALTRSWIGFEDVIVRLGAGTFDLAIVEETRSAFQIQKSWHGRFTADDALVIAGIALPLDNRWGNR